MNHTSGPWHVFVGGNFVHIVAEGFEDWQEKHKYLGGPYSVGSAQYCPTRNLSPAPQKALTNARLMAAAPELLEALKDVLDRFVSLVESGDCGCWNPEEEACVIAARAAIARTEIR